MPPPFNTPLEPGDPGFKVDFDAPRPHLPGGITGGNQGDKIKSN